MAARRDGNAVLSGHADGSLHVFNFDDGTTPAGTAKFAQHSCQPAAMTWGAQAALVTGNDCKVPKMCKASSAVLHFDGAPAQPDEHLRMSILVSRQAGPCPACLQPLQLPLSMKGHIAK